MIDILLKPNIIYKDNDFLVIEKPAGLLVHPTKYQEENTLVDWLLEEFPEIKDVGGKERPGIVHRLDREVSGLMAVAKTQAAYEHLVKQFTQNQIKKEYTALVHGQPPREKGTIDLPIGRTKKGKLVVVQSRKKIKLEKPAITEYEIIKKFSIFNFQFSLLKVRPLTGRTHQIRIHLKSIGCPIVGDLKYLPKHLRNQETDKLNRIFLHASYLGFYDLNGHWREFKSELPVELTNFLNNPPAGGKEI